MNLEGRVALVTGAARRVGRAIALRLARSGCRVAVHYGRSRADAQATVDLCRAAGAEAKPFAADLADVDETRRLVPMVLEYFGRLDILVNNASVFERMTLDEFDLERWRRTLHVNVTAPLMLALAARDALRAARGRIVNLCDVSSARPWPDHLAYGVSKGALDTLTRLLARAMAPDVNVVGVAPGVAAFPEHYDAALRAKLTAKIPLAREGTPEDIAAAVHFLVLEGDYVTGTILPIDGGRRLT
ncbi:MAG: SDR family oxidoreductase [Phycisphaerae bacterium]